MCLRSELVQQILERSWIETERLERIIADVLRRFPEPVEGAIASLACTEVNNPTIRAMCLGGPWLWIVFNGPSLIDLPEPVVAGIVLHELGHILTPKAQDRNPGEQAAEDAMYDLGFRREMIALWEAMRHLPLSHADSLEGSNLHSMEAAEALREGLPRVLARFSEEDGGLRAVPHSPADRLKERFPAVRH